MLQVWEVTACLTEPGCCPHDTVLLEILACYPALRSTADMTASLAGLVQ